MKLGHICNNYVGTKVHKNLINKLRVFCVQLVVVPYRESTLKDINKMDDIRISYSYIFFFNKFIRFFPLIKVLSITLKIYLRVKKQHCDHYIAHTLWSDGFCTYLLNKLLSTPYTLVVRGTDMNVFLPKLPHYRWIIKKVIKNSTNLIFLSPVYEKRFIECYPNLYKVANHVSVIPNGIDQFWFDNKLKINNHRNNQVCFVGRFESRVKNIKGVYEACLLAREKVTDLVLVLIGGNETQLKEILGINELPQWVDVKGFVKDKTIICETYRESRIFLMPSFSETFGLVYLEAFSQGCAVIYTKNEGFDGFFENEQFAIHVSPNNYEEIANSICDLIDEYSSGIPVKIISKHLQRVEWGQIAERYMERVR